MKMKRIAAAGLTAVMAASVLTACGGATSSSSGSTGTSSSGSTGTSSSGSTASGEQVTLKVSLWDATSNPADLAAIEAFEAANPDIKIDLIDIPSNDYNTKLNTMLNGGSQLDVFFIKQADSTKSFYDKGQLLDLTDYIAESGVDLSGFNGTADGFAFNGKQYGLPVRTDYYVLYYNKDLFDAKGIAYPSNDMTWTEFEKLAGELSGDGNYGAYMHTWQAMAYNWGIQDGKNTVLSYETGYDFVKPYYEMLLRMQDAGYIQDYGQLKSGNIHYSGAFAQGNVAMMPMGTWFLGTMKSKVESGEAKFNWGVATLPHPDGVEAGYTVGASTPLAINSATKNADAAWRFVEFMTGEEGSAVYSKEGYIPARSDSTILDTVAANEGMPEGLAEALQTKNIVPDRPIADHVGDVDLVLGEQHSMIMLGEATIDDALADLTSQVKDIMEG